MAMEPGARIEIDPEMEARVLRVGEEYLDELMLGREPDPEKYVRAHPDLREGLEAHLKLVALLHRYGPNMV